MKELFTPSHLPPRPSHPVPPSPINRPTIIPSQLIPPPTFPHRACRPRLRIITTSPPPIRPILRKPLPIHLHDVGLVNYPGLVKSAPLYYPSHDIQPCTNNITFAESQEEYGLLVQVHSPDYTVQVDSTPHLAIENKAPRRKRRFSDKFRHIFSHFPHRHHLQPTDHTLIHDSSKTNPILPSHTPPKRPARSPGTASFLIHRHLPTLPSSPTSTSPIIVNNLAPPELEISHFSNPTTCSSGRSVSDTGVSVISRGSARVKGRRVLDRWEGGNGGVCLI